MCMPVSQKFNFKDFSKRFKAIENIAAGDFVYVESSGLVDNFETYADDAAIQAVWVASDTLIAGKGYYNNENPSSTTDMLLQAALLSTETTYVDKTITSINLTGYTVHMVLVMDTVANAGDFELLLSSGVNAATSNVKKAFSLSVDAKWEHLSFTVASMDADNGTYDPAATVHVGIRNVVEDNASTVSINKIWFEKAGTTYAGIKKTINGSIDGDGYMGATFGAQFIGVSPNAVTAGNFGKVMMTGPVVGGYSNLVPGFVYFLDPDTPGGIIFTPRSDVYNGAINDYPSMYDLFTRDWGYSGRTVFRVQEVGIAVSDTELMLMNKSIYQDNNE